MFAALGVFSASSARYAEPSRGLELTAAIEPLRHRNGVARLSLVAEAGDRFEHGSMVVAIEIRRSEDPGDSIPGVIVDEHAAEHRLLGFDRMRRNPNRPVAGLRRTVGEEWIGHIVGDGRSGRAYRPDGSGSTFSLMEASASALT